MMQQMSIDAMYHEIIGILMYETKPTLPREIAEDISEAYLRQAFPFFGEIKTLDSKQFLKFIIQLGDEGYLLTFPKNLPVKRRKRGAKK